MFSSICVLRKRKTDKGHIDITVFRSRTLCYRSKEERTLYRNSFLDKSVAKSTYGGDTVYRFHSEGWGTESDRTLNPLVACSAVA